MKKLLTFALICMTAMTVNAQRSYNTAIGVKGGAYFLGGAGINLKHFINDANALEFVLGGGNNRLYIDGFYEWQFDTGLTPGLDWYAGLGVGLGFFGNNFMYDKHYKGNGRTYFNVGAIVGLDFTIPNVPINLAFDVGPRFGIFNSRGFGFGGALALRYAF